MKKFTSILCLLFVFVMILSIPVSAAQSYQTYTYSIDGKVLYSPDAYTPQKNVNSATMNLGELAMSTPSSTRVCWIV